MSTWLALACMGPGCLAEDPPPDEETRETVADTTVSAETTAEVSSEVEVGSEVGFDGTLAPSETQADGTLPPDAVSDVVYGTPSSVACHAGPLGATGIAILDQKTINLTPVLFDDGKLIGSRARSSDPMNGVSDLVAIDLTQGTEAQLLERDDLVMPLDARDGALLFATGDLFATRMHYVDPDVEPVTLYEGGFNFETRLMPPPFGWEQPVRHVERDLAVWREHTEGGYEGTMRVRALQHGSVATIWERDGYVGADVVLRGGRAAWLHSEGPTGLWVADLRAGIGEPPQEVVPDVLDFALTDDAVWWIDGEYTGGPVMRMDLATNAVSEAHPGPCRYLVGGAHEILTMCGEALTHDSISLAGGRPTALDGVTARVFPIGGELTTDGPAPAHVAVSVLAIEGDRAVWAEYPRAVMTELVPAGSGVLCHPGEGSSWLRLGTIASGAIETVGELAQGCWCCHNDGHWDRPDVQLRAEGMAWNYPATTPADNRENQKTPIGWLLFDQACATP